MKVIIAATLIRRGLAILERPAPTPIPPIGNVALLRMALALLRR